MHAIRWLVLVVLSIVACAHTSAKPVAPPPPLHRAQMRATFDPQAQLEDRPSGGRTAETLAVLDMQPLDRSRGEPIRLRFSRAVAAKADLPPVGLVVDRLLADGAWQHVDGRSSWTRADRIEFSPADPLPAAHRYRVRLEGDLGAFAGNVGQVQWAFETWRPTVAVVDPHDPIPSQDPILLWVDQPTSAASVRPHLRVAHGRRALRVRVSEAAADVRERWAYQARGPGWTLFAVHPARAWPLGAELSVAVSDGFRADGGVLGLGERFTAQVKTRDTFRVLGLRCPERAGSTCPLGPIGVAFSTTPDDFQGIRMVPEPDGFEVSAGVDDETALQIHGDFVPGQHYEIVLPRALADVDGQTISGRRRIPVRLSNVRAPGEAALWLSDERGIYGSLDDARVGLFSHRVVEARVRIAVLDAQEGLRYVEAEGETPPPWPEGGKQTASMHTLAPGRAERHTALPLALGPLAKLGDTVVVEASAQKLAPRTSGDPPPPVRGVFRISGLGVWTHRGPARGIVRVTDLRTGRPKPGVAVTVEGKTKVRALGKTDRDGIVALPGTLDIEDGSAVIARSDGDALAVPLPPYPWIDYRRYRSGCKVDTSGRCWAYRRIEDGGSDSPPKPLRGGERGLIGVAVGRGIYLPGDSVHVAGWAGITTPYGEHNTRRMPKGARVDLTLRMGDTEIATGRTRVTDHGRFSKTLTIPAGAPLGDYRLEAVALEGVGTTGFVVAQPRIPAFELHTRVKAKAIERGEVIRVATRANYLSGEEAPMHQMQWTIDCHPTVPPMLELPGDFSARTRDAVTWSRRGSVVTQRKSAVQFEIPTGEIDHRAGRQCHIAVSAQDGTNQPIGSDADVFVDPGPGYLAGDVGRAKAGERATIRAITVDRRGRRIAADWIRIEIHRRSDPDTTLLHTCTTKGVGARAMATCRTPELGAGMVVVRIFAEVEGKPLELERGLWVNPPVKPVAPTGSPRPSPSFEITGSGEVEVGVKTAVTILGPWTLAQGVLVVEQTGLREALPFTMRRGQATVWVQARHRAGPAVELTAHVTRPAEGQGKPRIETARHVIAVHDRAPLNVEIRAPQRARPGTKHKLAVRVSDAEGTPTSARVTVWVVDDALHQLRRPHRPNLAAIFNPDRPFEHMITDPHRALLDPFDPHAFAGRAMPVPRVRSAKYQVRGGLDPELRQRFKPVALFVGDVGTGPDGTVELPLQLADDITRFQVAVFASAELNEHAKTGPVRFGYAQVGIEVSAPLNVRAVLPRILRPGDEAELAALVTIPATGELEIHAKTSADHLVLRGPTARWRRVNKGDVVTIPFAVRAAEPGAVKIELVASLHSDSNKHLRGGVVRPLRIEVERTAVERAAVYGSVADDRPIAVPVILPQARHGRIDVTFTTTALGDLQEAARYLVDYPYGCVEQTASRLVPLLVLRGGRSWAVAGSEAGSKAVSKVIEDLQSMQLADGHFAYWPGSTDASAFGTAYATWVLLLADEVENVVPKAVVARALDALAADVTADLPTAPYARARALAERALAVRALAQAGDVPPVALDVLWAHRERLPVFARLVLLQALHRIDPADARIAPLLESLRASIEERPAVAHVVDPTEATGRWWYAWSSPTRTDALALQTLLELAPRDRRVVKLARGLRDRRREGRWRNTQENAFALLALSQYAGRKETEAPDHRLEAWIGPQRVVDANVVGFNLDEIGGAVGLWPALAESNQNRTHVVVRRRGQGRTYYRLGVAWSPTRAPARAQGLTLTRTLPQTLVAGEQARIEVALSTETPQRFVAVEVPLPAGLESVDVSVGRGTAARVAEGPERSPLLSHRELRPDRVLLFFDSLPPGSTTHSIAVVATTPGRFSVPAASAEAMYEPETRARTTRTRLEVRANPT